MFGEVFVIPDFFADKIFETDVAITTTLERAMTSSTESTNIIFRKQSEAADYFGVHRRTFCDWLSAGCPGKPGAYDLQEICRWIVLQRRSGSW